MTAVERNDIIVLLDWISGLANMIIIKIEKPNTAKTKLNQNSLLFDTKFVYNILLIVQSQKEYLD